MFTNEIKKGQRIRLACGWFGTMKDNGRGNTRIAEVEGTFTETGSVYSHDIVQAVNAAGDWEDVQYTAAQMKLKQTVKAFGF